MAETVQTEFSRAIDEILTQADKLTKYGIEKKGDAVELAIHVWERTVPYGPAENVDTEGD